MHFFDIFFAPSDFKCHYLCSNFAAKLKNRDVKLQKITTMELKKNKAEFLNCNLAGFGHTEGYLVLDEMRPGDKLYMVREDENKHDLDAIALFYVPKHELPKDTQLFSISLGKPKKANAQERTVETLHVGYIPGRDNTQLAQLMDFGHKDIFECVITYVDKEAHPNQQVQIRVNLLEKK